MWLLAIALLAEMGLDLVVESKVYGRGASIYRISQLADRAGVPATTLRFYEQQGLLPVQRSPAGYRLYDEDAVERLAFIAAGKHLGLPLQEIRDLLVVWESGLCVQVQDQLRPHLRRGIAVAQQRVLELRPSSRA